MQAAMQSWHKLLDSAPCHIAIGVPCTSTHAAVCMLQIYPTKEFSTFPDALMEVARQDVFQANLPSAAAFACAGPVARSKCEMTNLSWVIDGPYLSHTHGIRWTPTPVLGKVLQICSIGWFMIGTSLALKPPDPSTSSNQRSNGLQHTRVQACRWRAQTNPLGDRDG